MAIRGGDQLPNELRAVSKDLQAQYLAIVQALRDYSSEPNEPSQTFEKAQCLRKALKKSHIDLWEVLAADEVAKIVRLSLLSERSRPPVQYLEKSSWHVTVSDLQQRFSSRSLLSRDFLVELRSFARECADKITWSQAVTHIDAARTARTQKHQAGIPASSWQMPNDVAKARQALHPSSHSPRVTSLRKKAGARVEGVEGQQANTAMAAVPRDHVPPDQNKLNSLMLITSLEAPQAPQAPVPDPFQGEPKPTTTPNADAGRLVTPASEEDERESEDGDNVSTATGGPYEAPQVNGVGEGLGGLERADDFDGGMHDIGFAEAEDSKSIPQEIADVKEPDSDVEVTPYLGGDDSSDAGSIEQARRVHTPAHPAPRDDSFSHDPNLLLSASDPTASLHFLPLGKRRSSFSNIAATDQSPVPKRTRLRRGKIRPFVSSQGSGRTLDVNGVTGGKVKNAMSILVSDDEVDNTGVIVRHDNGGRDVLDKLLGRLWPPRWLDLGDMTAILNVLQVPKFVQTDIVYDFGAIPDDPKARVSWKGRPRKPPPTGLVLAPIYLHERRHWGLLRFDVANSKTTFLDSLRASPHLESDNIEDVARACVEAMGHAWDEDGWHLVRDASCPQQEFADCAVFVVVFVLCIVADRPFPPAVHGDSWRRVLHSLAKMARLGNNEHYNFLSSVSDSFPSAPADAPLKLKVGRLSGRLSVLSNHMDTLDTLSLCLRTIAVHPTPNEAREIQGAAERLATIQKFKDLPQNEAIVRICEESLQSLRDERASKQPPESMTRLLNLLDTWRRDCFVAHQAASSAIDLANLDHKSKIAQAKKLRDDRKRAWKEAEMELADLEEDKGES